MNINNGKYKVLSKPEMEGIIEGLSYMGVDSVYFCRIQPFLTGCPRILRYICRGSDFSS